MVNLDIWQLLAAFVAAMGIPGAVMGLLIRKIERRISKREAAMEQREAEQDELRMMLVQSTWAAIALGEATAKAVQRIPDAHCNGDMREALEYAGRIKHGQKEFLTRLGICALHND